MVGQNLDIKIIKLWDFPGSPVVKTSAAKVQGRECRFYPWQGTKTAHALWHGQKKKKNC